MKNIGLICAVALISMSLAACSNQASKEKLRQAEASSLAEESSDTLDKVSDKELFSDDDESTDTTEDASDADTETDENKASTFSTSSANMSSIQLSSSSSVKIQKPQFNNSTTDPITRRVQAETAKMQHDWNVKHGIENPDGSETQNFKKWVAKRDQVEANGQRMPEYDQNQKY